MAILCKHENVGRKEADYIVLSRSNLEKMSKDCALLVGNLIILNSSYTAVYS